MPLTVKQIRWVFDDYLDASFHISRKNICCGCSLELPWWGGSNEYLQHMFFWRIVENYPWIIIKYQSYLFHWCNDICTHNIVHDLTKPKWPVRPAKTQIRPVWSVFAVCSRPKLSSSSGERGGSVVECRTPEREVRGSKPTAAVLCPWARHFTPRKYWLITQEAMNPSRHDWKIVDWDVKPQHNQPSFLHADREDSWSDWADAQADLNLCWVHRSFCWFCHTAAHMWNLQKVQTKCHILGHTLWLEVGVWSFTLSYDVAVIQWITSCHKNRMSTRYITFWCVHVTS